MKIAVGQLCSSSNPFTNARVARKLINQAVQAKAQVLFLPEATDYLGRNAQASRELAQHSPRFVHDLCAYIKSLQSELYVSIGVHAPGLTSEDRIKNEHLWITPQGEVAQKYQKIHLYDVSVINGPILMESKAVEPGKALTTPFAIGSTPFSLGLAICYDIRFPEVAIDLRRGGADIITFPSAFTTVTGAAHWQTLGKARALDSQSYVVMAAQCGVHNVDEPVDADASSARSPDSGGKPRQSYGNSIVVDPWGAVVAEARVFSDDLDTDGDGDYYELITAELDHGLVSKIRENMPLLDHRRPYSVL
ncbi:deaminated glutathione amidase [Diutina catenulata]